MHGHMARTPLALRLRSYALFCRYDGYSMYTECVSCFVFLTSAPVFLSHDQAPSGAIYSLPTGWAMRVSVLRQGAANSCLCLHPGRCCVYSSLSLEVCLDYS